MTLYEWLQWIQSTITAIGPSIFYWMFAVSIGMFILRLNSK